MNQIGDVANTGCIEYQRRARSIADLCCKHTDEFGRWAVTLFGTWQADGSWLGRPFADLDQRGDVGYAVLEREIVVGLGDVCTTRRPAAAIGHIDGESQALGFGHHHLKVFVVGWRVVRHDTLGTSLAFARHHQRHGLYLDATEMVLGKQIQLAFQFVGRYVVARPPPTGKGGKAQFGLRELRGIELDRLEPSGFAWGLSHKPLPAPP